MAKITELKDDQLAKQISIYRKLVKEGDGSKKVVLKKLLAEAERRKEILIHKKSQEKSVSKSKMKAKGGSRKKGNPSRSRKIKSSPKKKASRLSLMICLILLLLVVMGGGAYGLVHFGVFSMAGLSQITQVLGSKGMEGTYVNGGTPPHVIVITKMSDGTHLAESFDGGEDIVFSAVDEQTLSAYEGKLVAEMKGEELLLGGELYVRSKNITQEEHNQLKRTPNELHGSSFEVTGKDGVKVGVKVELEEGRLLVKTDGYDEGEFRFYAGRYVLILDTLDRLTPFHKEHLYFKNGSMFSVNKDRVVFKGK